MEKVIENGLVPNIDHPVAFEGRLERMRTEGPKTHRQQTKRCRYSEKCNGHISNRSWFALQLLLQSVGSQFIYRRRICETIGKGDSELLQLGVRCLAIFLQTPSAS